MVILAGMGIVVLLVAVIVLFVIYYQKRMLQKKVEMHNMEVGYQKGLLKASLHSQEKERRRIARDLHDEVGAMLAATKLSLNMMLRKLASNSPETKVGLETKDMIDETINNVRRISKDLLPATLEEFGLEDAIREIASMANQPEMMEVVFNYEGNKKELDKEKALSVYRVVQELLNNAIKHSEASRIDISMYYDTDLMNLIVKDNGVGFSVDNAQNNSMVNKGIGLKNIESRLSTINGMIEYISVPDNGTEARIKLKL
jgi:signal transduction histidine kinase